jgi:hypothetical protein
VWVAIDYIFSLGFRVLRGADLGFLEPLVEARCSTTGPKVSSLSGYCLNQLNLTDRCYLFSALPPFDVRGVEAGGF